MNPDRKKIIVIVNMCWTILVICAFYIYFFYPYVDNDVMANLLLGVFAFPISFLVTLFNVSDRTSLILSTLFGYLQWNLVGLLIGNLIMRRKKTSQSKGAV